MTDARQSIRRPVLLYEAGCRFCRWAARVVAALDRTGALAFLPLESEDAGVLLAAIPENERLDAWRLALPDGRCLCHGEGIVVLLSHIRPTRPLASLLRKRTPVLALDRIDAFLAHTRRQLGRIVPDQPALRRYP